MPDLVDPPGQPTKWRGRLRLVINYFSKNFYQQLLFFLLPIYYASSTGWSLNLLFVAFLAVSALTSTFDVVYDRHLSVRRGLTAVFFAFNLFACINVMLPVLWSISNRIALPVSAVLAVAGVRDHPLQVRRPGAAPAAEAGRAGGDRARPARRPRPAAHSAGAAARAHDRVRPGDQPADVRGDRGPWTRCRPAGPAASTR